MSEIGTLLAASRPALRERLRGAFHVEPAWLEGTAWRGVSLGIPAWIERLTWKTFVKTFHRDPGADSLRGWNVRVEQHGVDGPIEPLRRRGHARTFGHYAVRPLAPHRLTADLSAGVLLDYGAGGNARLDPTRLLRDPVGALDASGTLLLGWSWVDLGPGIPTPSWFLLRRFARLDDLDWGMERERLSRS